VESSLRVNVAAPWGGMIPGGRPLWGTGMPRAEWQKCLKLAMQLFNTASAFTLKFGAFEWIKTTAVRLLDSPQ